MSANETATRTLLNRTILREILECGGWQGMGLTPLLVKQDWRGIERESFESGVGPHPSPAAVQNASEARSPDRDTTIHRPIDNCEGGSTLAG